MTLVHTDAAAAVPVAIPGDARVLALRVVCVRTPGSLGGSRSPETLLLAVGERGRDPDLVFAPDQATAVIETQLCLARTGTGLAVDGRYLAGHHVAPALELRWGVRSPRGHFLLVSGLHLRLPRFLVRRGGPAVGPGMPVLTTTVAVTDPDGVPLRGAVEAIDLDWRLAPARVRTAVPLYTEREIAGST